MLKALVLLFLLSALLLYWADHRVSSSTEDRIFSDLEAVPAFDAALVLGTSKYTSQGRPNSYYASRIKAAADLYLSGKVRGLVVSGDNRTAAYNEPQRMKEDLMAAGVPAAHITCDYAGFRTLDSVVRMGAVFRMKNYLVVSQEFHVARALYIAEETGQEVYGFAAPDGATAMAKLKNRVREVFARAMAVIDVHFLERGPKFLGEPVNVGMREAGEKQKP